jgi:hypothetical protein
MSCDKNSDRLANDVAEFIRGEHGRFANTRAAADHPVKQFGNLAEAYRSTEGCLYVFLRKNAEDEFRVALDLPDDMDDRQPPGDDRQSQSLPRKITRVAASLALRKVLTPLTRRLSRLA